MFFVWYDDTPKKPSEDKLREGIAAYIERFKIPPTLVLVNLAEQLSVPDMIVRCERTVQPNSFWIGREDGASEVSA